MNISQSLIKYVRSHGEDKDTCPHMIYHMHFLKTYKNTPEKELLFEGGNYFESLCLGANRDGTKTTDMTRKKLTKAQEKDNLIRKAEGKIVLDGEKTIKQIRIEEQARRFPTLCAKNNINVIKEINTQVHIKKRLGNDIIGEGTLDLFPTTIISSQGLKLCIIDLKLTGSIDNRYGDYCWGEPERLDKIQAKMYSWLVRNIDLELNPHLKDLLNVATINILNEGNFVFVYWVFDTDANMLGHKFIPVKWEIGNDREVEQELKVVYNRITEFANDGWKCNPIYSLCKSCSCSVLLGGHCSKYTETDGVI